MYTYLHGNRNKLIFIQKTLQEIMSCDAKQPVTKLYSNHDYGVKSFNIPNKVFSVFTLS